MIARAVHAAALAALIPLTPSAHAADDFRFVVNDEKIGLVRAGPAPEFPPSALARHISGFVDVVGEITERDTISHPTITPDRDESAVFAAAVRDVLPRWRFNPELDDECRPTGVPARLRIYFEWNADRPGIRVTHAPVHRAPDVGLKPLHRVGPRYPFRMLENSHEGVVYSRMEIAPDGSVSGVRSRPYSPDAMQGDLYAMREETNAALRQWRFNAAPEGTAEIRLWCQTMVFRIQ